MIHYFLVLYKKDFQKVCKEMLISDALKLKERAFLSLVGAGGKSSLLQIIARELVEKKKKVILTTTTKMFANQISTLLEVGQIIESTNARSMEDGIKDYFGAKRDNRIAILLKERLTEEGREKFSGPEPYYINKWWQEGLADFFIVEADGAKGRAIKAPDYHEPVVASMTTDVVAVIGIDSVGLRLAEENVFRSTLFSHLTGLKWGKIVTTKEVIALINHPAGLYKNSPNPARRFLFLNKVNNSEKEQIAEEIALSVIINNQANVDIVIIGDTLREENKVLKMISGKIE